MHQQGSGGLKRLIITERPKRTEIALYEGEKLLASATGKNLVSALRKLATEYQAKLDAAELSAARTVP
jgi:hypothetical protein